MLPPQPAHEPSDPNRIGMWRIWFAPVMMVQYTRNWARLGKPEWGKLTARGGLLILAWMIAGLVALMLNIGSVLALGFFIAALMTNLAFWIIIGHWQGGAYKTWTATHDWAALCAHPYRVDKTVSFVIAASVIGTVAITGWLWADSRPHRYSSSDLSLKYDSWWTSRALNDGFCQDYDNGCFLVLTDDQYGFTSIAFARQPLAEGMRTAEDADADLWENYWGWVSGVELVSHTPILIDGLPGIAREFLYPQPGDDPFYILTVVVVNDHTRYDITAWASNRAIFEEDRARIMKVINSLDFKASGATV